MAELNTSARIVYELPGMEQVIVKKNITYKTVDSTDLQLDVYYPAAFQNDKPLPAVLFLHGDGPPEMLKNIKDWGQYISWGQLISASGFIAVTSNHRSTLQSIPEVASDIADLIAYVRTNASSLNIDQERFCLWTASAGAPYGLCAALREKPEFVRCVVAYYGILDLLPLYQFYPTLSEEILREFSPAQYLSTNPEKVPPLLITKAALDHPQLNETIHRFVTEAIQKNITVDFLTHPQGQHGFDVLDDNPISRSIIKYTVEFITEHLMA